LRALDTNVIVRVLTRDDPAQAAIAADAMREGPVFVPLTVMLETEWVLRYTYGFPRERIADALEHLLALDQATVERADVARQALEWHRQGLDLADALHLASSSDASEFVTFDRGFAREAKAAGCMPPVRRLGEGGA